MGQPVTTLAERSIYSLIKSTASVAADDGSGGNRFLGFIRRAALFSAVVPRDDW